MRFWITKNSELPIREQLVRQVLLGILSEDLPPGHKLPSVRAMALRYRIHANTVSAAYHDLLERGWLELRRGSGLYVRPLQPIGDEPGGLDSLLTALLQAGRRQGYEPEEVLQRLERLVRPRSYERILVVEPDPGMREILQAEIGEHLRVPVEGIGDDGLARQTKLDGSLVVALATRAVKIRNLLPSGSACLALRLRSVRGSLERQTRPASDRLVAIVSRSVEIRFWARGVLIAVGLAPECLCEIDAAIAGWRDRLGAGTLAITDIVTARELPPGCEPRVFRVISDASIGELKQFCSV